MDNRSFLQNKYLKELKSNQDSLKSSSLEEFNNCEIPKPTKIPDKVWHSFSQQEKAINFLRGVSTGFLAIVKNAELNLSEQDFLQINFRHKFESEKAFKIFCTLFKSSYNNENNFTLDNLCNYVNDCVKGGKALRLETSHCIDRSVYRNAAFKNRLLNQKTPINNFDNGVKIKGWESLKSIQESLGYPVEITLVLGDMDYFVLEDGLDSVTDEQSIDGFKSRMQTLKEETQLQANEYFGQNLAQVDLWSQRYSLADFNASFDTLKSKLESQFPAEVKNMFMERLNDHYRRWGYSKYIDECSVSKEELDKIIWTDLIRMATHYSLESEITRESNKAQIWTEKSSNMNFLLTIAHLGREQKTPSLFIN